MGAIEFFGVIGVFAYIVAWYMRNEMDAGFGELGLLGVAAEVKAGTTARASYSIEKRGARNSREANSIEGHQQKIAVRKSSYRMRDGAETTSRRSYKTNDGRRAAAIGAEMGRSRYTQRPDRAAS